MLSLFVLWVLHSLQGTKPPAANAPPGVRKRANTRQLLRSGCDRTMRAHLNAAVAAGGQPLQQVRHDAFAAVDACLRANLQPVRVYANRVIWGVDACCVSYALHCSSGSGHAALLADPSTPGSATHLPISAGDTPYASSSRSAAVAAIDTTSSLSLQKTSSSWPSPSVYLPGTPSASSRSVCATC